MVLKAEFLAHRARLAPAIALAAAWLAGCGMVPALEHIKPATAAKPQAAVQAPAPASSAAVPAPPSAVMAPPPASEPLVQALAYADRVRGMTAGELGQEVARLGNPYVPASQLQLALVLGQLRQVPELIRAQEVLGRLLANTDAQAVALHPLARLLGVRYAEQRRLEDLLDKQNQQTREVQRRLDQTNERLEALKAIERSLTSRLPAPAAPAASAPASRSRPSAP
ncbi:MAG: hypothetical protein JWR60_1978 [Polaromonas sp.]|nr:hypothetical protein [Polaromonas sp.]